MSSPPTFVYLITFTLAVRRVLVMWLPCLLYLPFNFWVVAVAGLGLGDVVRSTYLAVNVYT